MQLAFAYKLELDEKQSLAFGVSANLGLFTSITSNLNSRVDIDPSKYLNQQNRFNPNMGIGLLYRRSRFFAGISAPKIFETSLDGSKTYIEKRHLYTQIGGVFKISEMWKLRPTSQICIVKGSPLNVDISVAGIYQEKFIFGTLYRVQAAFGAFVQFQLNEKFRIGIASDFSTQRIRNFNFGTYEIGISYDLSLAFHKGQTFRYF